MKSCEDDTRITKVYLERYDVWGKFSSISTHDPELGVELITPYDHLLYESYYVRQQTITLPKNPVLLYWQLKEPDQDLASWAIISLAVLQCSELLEIQRQH